MPALGQEDLRRILPPRLFAVPGVEMNVYFDNVLLHPNSEDLIYDVDCSFGAQHEERWTGVPADANVGQARLTLRVLTPEMQVVEEQEAMIEIAGPAAGQGEQITVLCVGDSLTAASQYTARLVELFGADEAVDATLIGESGPGGDTGNQHEGYGGWTCERFATLWNAEDYAERGGRMRRARSPFVFEIDGEPRLSFQRYLDANNGGEAPDFITILLGCNDTFSADEETIEARIDTMFGHLDTLIAAFREAAPDTQIGLLTLVPPAASQDAFGRNYRCGQTRWQYRRNQHRVVERQYETYSGREDGGLFVVPAHANLDTVWGFPRVALPPNAHSEEEVSRMSNGVHPARAGYYQIGDSIYCWLKSRLGAE
jgi:lysophospholipase L1-like esterase